MPTPIAVMSFKRPKLLEKVLLSLSEQRDSQLAQREIHLFQDNAVNGYSRIRYAADDEIQGCVKVFQSVFPKGVVHLAPYNVGVCENFKRAEEYVFGKREFDCAYFFEDDMVLSPAYLTMMDSLQKQARSKSSSIAYFAAYGDYYASQEEIRPRRDKIIGLDHHWAFGLFREHWVEINKWLGEYYSLVVGKDYARRNHHAIYKMYEKLGACPRGSSQDAAKAFACSQLGFWRCRTVLPFAKYIGAEGAHMDRETYDRLKFDYTKMEVEPAITIKMPDDASVRTAVADDANLFRQIYKNEFAALTSGLSSELNPMRPVTAEDIIATYRMLLHREPENESIFERHVGRTPAFVFTKGILRSAELARLLKVVET